MGAAHHARRSFRLTTMAARRYSTTTLPAILAMRDQGRNWSEIAKRLNVSPDTLRSAMSLLGIKGAVQAKTAQYPVREWVQRLALGDTVPEIASSHGLSRMAVYGVLRHRGLPTTCRAAIKARAGAVHSTTGGRGREVKESTGSERIERLVQPSLMRAA